MTLKRAVGGLAGIGDLGLKVRLHYRAKSMPDEFARRVFDKRAKLRGWLHVCDLLRIADAICSKSVTLRFVPFHFVPGHFVRHFVPWSFRTGSFRPLVISSQGHFVPSFYQVGRSRHLV
jgi:hypothetical protein